MQISCVKSNYDPKNNPAFGMELKGDTRKFLYYLVGKGKITEEDIKMLEDKAFKPGCWANITRDAKANIWHVSQENEKIEAPEQFKELMDCYRYIRYSQMPDVTEITADVLHAGRNIKGKPGAVFDVKA